MPYLAPCRIGGAKRTTALADELMPVILASNRFTGNNDQVMRVKYCLWLILFPTAVWSVETSLPGDKNGGDIVLASMIIGGGD